jgi:hypothetical protein
MSSVAIQGNSSGAGVFTIASPNSASSYTATLPAATGTIALTSNIAGGPRAQYFTTTGANTFTIPAGITSIKVTMVSGGGGGAGYNTGTCSNGGNGGLGNSGVQWFVGLTPGNTLSVTVGAGGVKGNSGNPPTAATTGGTSSIASGTQAITTFQITGGILGAANGNFNNAAQGTVTGVSNGGSGDAGYYSLPGGSTLQIAGVTTGARGAGSNSTNNQTNGAQGVVLIEY